MASISLPKNTKVGVIWVGWGCIRGGVVFFQNDFLTGVLQVFEWDEVLFKNRVAFKPIR